MASARPCLGLTCRFLLMPCGWESRIWVHHQRRVDFAKIGKGFRPLPPTPTGGPPYRGTSIVVHCAFTKGSCKCSIKGMVTPGCVRPLVTYELALCQILTLENGLGSDWYCITFTWVRNPNLDTPPTEGEPGQIKKGFRPLPPTLGRGILIQEYPDGCR